ncbi:ribosomal protein L7/L12 [Pseudomonas sp. LPH60]|uniref:type IV secretory system conjugative DNA transfer family protein n=1 Tax=Pseudomonas sp. LPH60 TaxID=3065906 RepID=UPI00273C6C80|nr:ribosomal protein L7/L12 [Pseudomonas sp. LPH60]MDP4573442.1 ribosomal protein L7/L12 [Pseudomonas sp. LPH60]
MDKPNWVKWVFGLIVLMVASAAIVWLSGFLFFVLSKANPFGKTDFSTWWTYWDYYKTNADVVKRLKISLIIATVVCYGLPLFGLIAALREERSLHGDARFATASEVEKAGLFGSTGIIVGKLRKRFLMFAGMQFVLLAAPTRSGKGVSTVIPNLLNWNESVVATDIKLENFLITSKYRSSHNHEVYLFNPFAVTADAAGNPLQGKSHRYNPLGYISDDTRLRITDILAIGYSLYPGEGRDAFFDDAARNLFLGLCLYLCETPTLPRTIGELLRQSSGKGRPVKEHIQGFITERNYREYANIMLNDVGDNREEVVAAVMAIRKCEQQEAESLCDEAPIAIAENVSALDAAEIDLLLKATGCEFELDRFLTPIEVWDGIGLPPLTAECVDALNRFTSTSDNTMSSIMATFNVPLTLWASPVIDAATSANDFDLRNVRKKLMSIYLGIPANKLAEAKVILNLFYTQLVNLNTDQLLHATPELKFTCLMLDDEFTAPGRIGIIDKSNSYMAGYGLRLLTIIQSPGQLEAEPPRGYGKESARTFVTNHALQILFTPRDQRDANEYSEMLGYSTAHSRGKNYGRGATSHSEQVGPGSGQKRALMLPQELKAMPQNRQVIGMENMKPIMCEKIFYYAEHIFMNRLKSVSPTLAALGKKLPSKDFLEAVWGSGELASSIPALDLDLHEAIVQDRVRETTVEDIQQGIDLRKIAVDLSKITVTTQVDGLAEEQIEDFVNDFFDALGATRAEGSEEADEESFDFNGDFNGDGSSEPITDAELAALDAEIANEDSEPETSEAMVNAGSGPTPILKTSKTPAVEIESIPLPFEKQPEPESALPAVRHDELLEEEISDEELAALIEADDHYYPEDFDEFAFAPEDSEGVEQYEALREFEAEFERSTIKNNELKVLDLSILDEKE